MSTTGRTLRAGAACLLGLLVCAWFALGIRQSTDQSRAEAIIAAGPPSPAQARRAERLLNSAGTLNPDRQIDLDRSSLLNQLGRRLAARRIALSVARAEPQNLTAWLAVGATVGDNRRLGLTIIAHVLRLDPLH
jgi:hypothetical protein